MFGRFVRDQRGNFTVLLAIMLTSLVGVAGLVTDCGNGLYNRLADQRVADIAAMAGARVYDETQSSSSVSTAVTNVGALNGVSGGSISETIGASPSGDGNQAVKVIVTSQVPLVFGRLLRGPTAAAIAVQATSYAEMQPGQPGCIMALNPAGPGVTVTSASGITADACAVESGSTVTASSASNITTVAIDYDTTPPTATGASTIAAPSGQTLTITKAPVTDPLAGNSAVATATARLSTVEALTSPASPPPVASASGNLAYSASAFTGKLPAGCTQTSSGSSWTVTCSGGSPYDMGSLGVTSTANVSFNTSGSASNVYNFTGITVSSSGQLTFGPGTFNVGNGETVASSSSATFGAGTFDIGPSTSTCTDGGKYSLCVESATSLTMGGPSSFNFGGGVYAGSSATIRLGSGTANSYEIGSSSNGNSAVAASSSNLLFADATSGSGLFQLVGNVTAASGACVALPDASEHDIEGGIVANSASKTTLGAGVYTVSGYLDDESASGGAGCSGWTGGTAGTGVTFVLGAKTTPASGACESLAICVLSASNASMVAPSSGATAGLVVIGPQSSSNTAGGLFESASSGSFSGVVYLPNGAVNISSASGLGGGSGACLVLIGAQISVTSASATGSTCTGVNTSPTDGSVALVQ